MVPRMPGTGSSTNDQEVAQCPFFFNEKVIVKLAELYKEAGQLGHLLVSIDKLILYYDESTLHILIASRNGCGCEEEIWSECIEGCHAGLEWQHQ